MEKAKAAQLARKTLRILDLDGWCKRALTWESGYGTDYPDGSHCIGGAWNIALTRGEDWVRDYRPYVPLVEAIQAQYPEFRDIGEDDVARIIAIWNNRPERTESEVRAILEKIAAC